MDRARRSSRWESNTEHLEGKTVYSCQVNSQTTQFGKAVIARVTDKRLYIDAGEDFRNTLHYCKWINRSQIPGGEGFTLSEPYTDDTVFLDRGVCLQMAVKRAEAAAVEHLVYSRKLDRMAIELKKLMLEMPDADDVETGE